MLKCQKPLFLQNLHIFLWYKNTYKISKSVENILKKHGNDK